MSKSIIAKPLTDTASIRKEIDGIKVAGAKLDERIQVCAVAVVEHFAKHNDTGLVNRLYLALPKGARKTAMASWMMAYMAVTPNTDAKTKAEQPFRYSKDKTTNPEAAANDMWYDHKPDPSVDMVFDLQKAVKALLIKAGKAGKWEHGNRDTLVALAAAVSIPESDVPSKPFEAEKAEEALM
jgi:hypothetical protein